MAGFDWFGSQTLKKAGGTPDATPAAPMPSSVNLAAEAQRSAQQKLNPQAGQMPTMKAPAKPAAPAAPATTIPLKKKKKPAGLAAQMGDNMAAGIGLDS